MPKLNLAIDLLNHSLASSSFGFSAVKPETLTSSSAYTLVHFVVDNSGSVGPFKDLIHKALISGVSGCTGPKVSNLLTRVTTFDQNLNEEIHGFIPLSDIDLTKYPAALPCDGGGTALFDATINALEAVQIYAKQLRDKEYNVNAVVFVLTDGCDNASKARSGKSVKKIIDQIKQEELMESLTTILIKVNVDSPHIEAALTTFAQDAEFSQTEKIELINSQHVGKMAKFISKSMSASASANGTGGPSKAIVF